MPGCCAQMRARRGLAKAALGQAASAIVDADRAVLAYLEATGGDLDHPLVRDLARVVSVNAVVLARHGDPDLAVASADAALGYYGYATERYPGGRLPAEDGGYLRAAASVSAMFHLAGGQLADGFYSVLVIVRNLAPGEVTEPLEYEMAYMERLLVRSEETNRPVPYTVDFGRPLAGALLSVLRGTGVLWLPGGELGPGQDGGPGWPGWDMQTTIEGALGRHATGPRDAGLFTNLTGGQPRELVWTPSMRWPRRQLACGDRLAELAIETVPRAYADGLRLALDAHALLAARHQRPDENAAVVPDEYIAAWRRLLTETVATCRAAEDDALADNLALLEAAVG